MRIHWIGRFLLTIGVFVSCRDMDSRGIQNEAVSEEIKNREIQHVTSAQITKAAQETGRLFADTLQHALTDKMQTAVRTEGIIAAAQYCRLAALPVVGQLQRDYAASIRRIRFTNDPAESQLTEMEKLLLDAYRYNLEKKLPLEDNIQKSGANDLLYTAPITLNDAVCLQCHGKLGESLSLITYDSLKTKYRLDGLINYALRQPIGILSVQFPRKEIIKRINEG